MGKLKRNSMLRRMWKRKDETEGDDEKIRSGMQVRGAEINGIRALEGEGNERKFIISFSSEEPYIRWWGNEILDHSEGAVDLTRLNEIGCLLFNHDRDEVIGRINRAWIENRRGMAEVEFDTDEKSDVIYKKVARGTLKGVSVGYRIDVREEVEANKQSTDGRFKGPADIARRWTPFEISIVSVPADATVGVGREWERTTENKIKEGEKGVKGRSVDWYERQVKINKNKFFTGGR